MLPEDISFYTALGMNLVHCFIYDKREEEIMNIVNKRSELIFVYDIKMLIPMGTHWILTNQEWMRKHP